MDLSDMGCEDVNWIKPAQWRASMTAVVDPPRVQQWRGISWPGEQVSTRWQTNVYVRSLPLSL